MKLLYLLLPVLLVMCAVPATPPATDAHEDRTAALEDSIAAMHEEWLRISTSNLALLRSAQRADSLRQAAEDRADVAEQAVEGWRTASLVDVRDRLTGSLTAAQRKDFFEALQ